MTWSNYWIFDSDGGFSVILRVWVSNYKCKFDALKSIKIWRQKSHLKNLTREKELKEKKLK